MIRKLGVLACAASVAVALVACGDEEDDATPVRELVEQEAGGFTLDEESLRDEPPTAEPEPDEAVAAIYADPSGGQVSFALASLGSEEEAADYLDAVVAGRLDEGFEIERKDEAKDGGELVVLFKSPGVQAVPPEFVFAWTSGELVAETRGTGDAAERLYVALPY